MGFSQLSRRSKVSPELKETMQGFFVSLWNAQNEKKLPPCAAKGSSSLRSKQAHSGTKEESPHLFTS
jgi:hypothetical protein